MTSRMQIERRRVAQSIGVLLPPFALIIGTMVPASDLTLSMILLCLVVSGGLIGSWWAPGPSNRELEQGGGAPGERGSEQVWLRA